MELISFNWTFIGWLLLAILSCYITFSDIKKRLIPNWSCLAVLVVTISVSNVSYDASWAICVSLGVFFLFFLYFISFWGGGDTKIAIAFLPAISEQYTLLFMVGIGLLGGVLLCVYLVYGLVKGMDRVKTAGLPFGVPICLSGLLFVAASL